MGPDMPAAAAAALEAAFAPKRKDGQPGVKSASKIQLATSSGDDDDDAERPSGDGWATTVDSTSPTQRPGPALVPAPAIPRISQAQAAAMDKINSAWTAHFDGGSGAMWVSIYPHHHDHTTLW